MNAIANLPSQQVINNAILAGSLLNSSDKQITSISFDRFATLLNQSTELQKLDLGCALVILAHHRTLGAITLINTTGDEHALIH